GIVGCSACRGTTQSRHLKRASDDWHCSLAAQNEKGISKKACSSRTMAQPRVTTSTQWRSPLLAVLSYGFRPFFRLGAAFAAIAIPIWLVMLGDGVMPAGPFQGMRWHAHEMIFGYLAAIIAGFALTAVPNWTGRLPLSGFPLAGLVGLWLAGRFACSF